MIHVRIAPYSLYVSGHAGQNVHGKDIVCAAASVLIYATGEMLEQNRARCHHLHVSLASGRGEIIVDPSEDFREECDGAMAVARYGFLALAAQYPEYVAVSE